MAPKPRDLNKTRAQRIGEVYTAVHEKTGQFDGQFVAFGCALAVGGTNTQLAMGAGEVIVNGAIASLAAVAGAAVPAGAATAAGQVRKVLVSSDKNGALTLTPGAVAATGVQADAVLPRTPSAGLIDIGWLELPASFTPGTTPLTGAMVKQMAWSGA